MAQRLINMLHSYITEPLSAALRTLSATLVLLVFPMGVWGQEWTEVSTWVDLQTAMNTGGNIRLSGSITRNIYDENQHNLVVPNGVSVTLDLNGNNLSRHLDNSSATIDGYVIMIKSGGNLTITGNTNGYITGGHNSGDGGAIINHGTLTILGGRIENNKSLGNGGAIYNDGELTLNGGNIVNNETTAGNGGAIYNNGTMTMINSWMVTNKALSGYGGAIFNAVSKELTISGGDIGTSSNSFANKAQKGGGVYNDGILTLEGSSIEYNQATVNGGGVYYGNGTLTVKGAPKVYNNSGGNLYLATGRSITIGDGFTSEASIFISMETLGTFTSGFSVITGNISNYFSPDDYRVFFSQRDVNNEAQFKSYWSKLQEEINSATDAVEKTINLLSILNFTGAPSVLSAHSSDNYIHIPSGKVIKLNLNKDLNRNLTEAKGNGYVIKNEGTLTLYGDGTIKGGYNNADGGGIYNTGTLNLEGLKVKNNQTSSGNGGGIYHDGSTITMKGNVEVKDNSCSGTPNNLFLPSGKLITRGDAVLSCSDESIGITLQSVDALGTIFTTGLAENEYKKFKADDVNTYDIGCNASYQARYQTPWIGLKLNFEEGVNVQLNKNYTAPVDDYLTVGSGKTLTLDLNGWTIDRGLSESSARADGYLINIPSGTSLTIKDSGGSGSLTGGKMDGNGGCIVNAGTLEIQSGTITDNSATGEGGAIYNTNNLTISGGIISNNSTTGVNMDGGAIYNASGATMTLSGGTITANNATGNGGGFYNANSVTISGGTISSNSAAGDGGGIYNNSTLTIYGGTISSNNVTGDSKNGGGIYNANSGTLNIQGGTIQNNTTTGLGGGVYVHSSGTVNMQGTPTITGNTVGEVANNVYLPTGKTITIDGALSGDGKVGISVQAVTSTGTVFTSSLSGNGSYTKFSPDLDNTKYETADKNGEAQVQTYWTGLQTLLSAGGSVTLSKNYTAIDGIDTHLVIPSGKTVNLNLNGYTINRNLSSSSTDRDYVIQVQAGAALTITGSGSNSVIKGGYNTSDAGGVYNSGKLTINGAYISNNTTTGNGGGVYNVGTLTMTGGTISNNTATGNGGGVYHAESATAFNLSGSPTIRTNTVGGSTNNVYLYGDKKINIAAAITDGSVGIYYNNTANSKLFTTGLNNGSHHFFADVNNFSIGLSSAGDAIVGKTYSLTRYCNGTPNAYVYINGEYTDSKSVVQGQKITITINPWSPSNYIPYSLTYNPSGEDQITVPGSSYPKYSENYTFDMPAQDVKVYATVLRGGYCGNETNPNSIEDMKYVLDGTNLKFVPKDATNPYAMKEYDAGATPWINFYYTKVYIPKNLTSISNYAFCDKNKKLATFEVEAGGTYYKAVGDLLFSNDEQTLYCYPSGKTDATTYEVPAAVTTIADGAFAYNTTITGITVAGGSYFFANDGVLYDYGKQRLYCYPAGKTGGTYNVPLSDGYNVTTIKPYAFAGNTNLQYLYLLHESVPTGGVLMFDGTSSSLKVMVKAGLKSGDGAKYDNTVPWNSYIDRICELTLAGALISLTPDPNVIENYSHYDYTGSEIKPTSLNVVSGAGDGLTLTEGVDYTVSYDYPGDNYTSVSTHTINITGIGKYAGTSTTTTYDITWIPINPGSGQYITCYSPFNLKKLYLSYGSDTFVITKIDWTKNPVEITLQSVDYIKANTPVLIYYSGNYNGVTYNWRLHEETDATKLAAAYPTSCVDFKGVTENTTHTNLIHPDAYTTYEAIYALKRNQFIRATGGTLPAYHCYIAKPSGGASRQLPESIEIGGEDGNATAIETPKEMPIDWSGDWYSIDGQKLPGMPTKKGIYILNGKKIIIK